MTLAPPELPLHIVHALRSARRVAVLTGAGVSAESGIPTFRDAMSGLWARFRPEELASPQAFRRNPRLVWDWYRLRRELIARVQPNPAHLALARLERLVPALLLITQNVDGLHQRAGSRHVVELHGNIMRARCTREGTTVTEWEEPDDPPPRCERCGAMLRPDVVWFGESLPEAGLAAATDAALECDVFLAVGTSNLVEPAASLPWMAATAGAEVVVVNTSDEGQRRGAHIHHLLGRAGVVLPALVDALDESLARGGASTTS